MRYTRYNYKKKNNNSYKVLTIFILLLLIALAVGRGLSGYFLKGIGLSDDNKKGNPEISQGETLDASKSFVIFQAGLYSKQENAEAMNNSLKDKYNSFIISDGDKFRVIVDIERGINAERLENELKTQGIAYAKSNILINKDELSKEEIAESLDALMQYYEKLKEGQVLGVKTEDLKKWSSELKKPDDSEANIKELQEINNYIQALPEELNKDAVPGLVNFIYGILVKFKA